MRLLLRSFYISTLFLNICVPRIANISDDDFEYSICLKYRHNGPSYQICISKELKRAKIDWHKCTLFVLLGESFLESSRPIDAKKAFEAALELGCTQATFIRCQALSGRAWLGLGRAREENDMTGALEAYVAGATVAPVQPALWYNAGYILLTTGRHADAERPLRTACRLAGDFAVAFEALGAAVFAQGGAARLEAAAHVFRRAHRLRPSAQVLAVRGSRPHLATLCKPARSSSTP